MESVKQDDMHHVISVASFLIGRVSSTGLYVKRKQTI